MIPMKIPTSYFVNINPLILNFMWTGKRLRMVDTAEKEENKGGGLLLWSTLMLWQSGQWIHTRKGKQINGTEHRTEKDPLSYSQLVFNKRAKTVFSTHGTGATGYPHAKKSV